MINAILSSPYWWTFYFGALILLVILVKVSMLIGAKNSPKVEKTQRAQPSTAANAMLALTGFLLAISFNIAEQKFSLRKKSVLEEANAVGTAYLRSYLLPSPLNEQSKQYIERYIRIRYQAVLDKRFLEGKRESEEIVKKLWLIAEKASKSNGNHEAIKLYIESVNNVIDLSEERWTVGIYYELPRTIAFMLLFATFFSVSLLAFSFGLKGSKNLFLALGPGLLFLLIAMIIIDLGHTHQRLFSISQEPLADTIRMIEDWK